MIKLLLKTTFLVLIFTSFVTLCKAQIGYDYAQYDFGFGLNANQVYGDAETLKTTGTAHVNFTFNQTPYVNYVFEVQKGKLEGGSIESLSGRYFKNNFTAVIFRGQLQAGEFIDYSRSGLMNGLKNLYISAGLGYAINNMDEINRVSKQLDGFTTGGEDKSNELYIPVRIGYEFKVFNKYDQPSFKIDLAYSLGLDLTDNMDGFTSGISKDKLVQFSLGLKFAIGSVTSYRKQIHY